MIRIAAAALILSFPLVGRAQTADEQSLCEKAKAALRQQAADTNTQTANLDCEANYRQSVDGTRRDMAHWGCTAQPDSRVSGVLGQNNVGICQDDRRILEDAKRMYQSCLDTKRKNGTWQAQAQAELSKPCRGGGGAPTANPALERSRALLQQSQAQFERARADAVRSIDRFISQHANETNENVQQLRALRDQLGSLSYHSAAGDNPDARIGRNDEDLDDLADATAAPARPRPQAGYGGPTVHLHLKPAPPPRPLPDVDRLPQPPFASASACFAVASALDAAAGAIGPVHDAEVTAALAAQNAGKPVKLSHSCAAMGHSAMLHALHDRVASFVASLTGPMPEGMENVATHELRRRRGCDQYIQQASISAGYVVSRLEWILQQMDSPADLENVSDGEFTTWSTAVHSFYIEHDNFIQACHSYGQYLACARGGR